MTPTARDASSRYQVDQVLMFSVFSFYREGARQARSSSLKNGAKSSLGHLSFQSANYPESDSSFNTGAVQQVIIAVEGCMMRGWQRLGCLLSVRFISGDEPQRFLSMMP